MTRSTANYIWYLEDVLGQGATSNVYKARNKKTGELVAAKVFNTGSYARPYEVQMREFEILRKLNHVNIVQLFAVEEMQINSQQNVLLMELCSGGSLLNHLEDYENYYGLPESEYLIVLQSVVNGMKHLRDNEVVHRDIKPGNIMRQVGVDGRSIYKLTDFGAARKLEDGETFMSIYGTEEYLHPDMYRRAVLRKPQQNSFGVTVDLWSIGVTFYHAATGRLPFIPFGGPRKNREMMYKITNEKPEGAIAGVQKVEDGPIEWRYHLPHYCQLSQGLRKLLEPLLAGILEANQEKCWDFNQFFTASMDIIQRFKVHVFSLHQATAHCIYIHFYHTVSVFFEDVQAQTGIAPEVQQYLFQGHSLPLEATMKVVNLPHTTEERPIFLLSQQPEKIAALPPREPEAPPMPSRFDVAADYVFSKTMVGVVHQYLLMVRRLHMHRDLLLQGFYSETESARVECNNIAHKVAMVNMKLLSCLSTEETLQTLDQLPFDFCDASSNMEKLGLIKENMLVYGGSIRGFQGTLHHLHVDLAKHSETLAVDRSVQKMEVLLEKTFAVHQQYYKDKRTGKLVYNDEQIHKFEKFNLLSTIKKVKVLFREDCLQKYQDVLTAVQTWSGTLYDMHSKLEHFSASLLQLIGDLQMCERSQTKVLDRVVQALQNPEAMDGPKNKDHMILRMKRLKDEMKLVAQELQNNNHIIERLGVFDSALVVEPDMTQPLGGR
ncbi:inhibitor of nuclear factor kappa-B kinase subunit epsilon [Brachyhypopomus gauderio]|uniref:inhibitor of nuclear factor kappa-B kinase subunit epsilon n=1 Tax=Brachyhypopomus gauderio TaxID=698409 RepID=UPI0040431454